MSVGIPEINLSTEGRDREYLESETIAPGTEIVTAKAGVATLGLSVCYDVRFPELYRLLALRGAEILVVPAAFTLQTGKDHWELLLRARAVENQAFVVAPAQWGQKADGRWTYGRSIIVDPWGTMLAQCPDCDGTPSPPSTSTPRPPTQRVPALKNRRPEAYDGGTSEPRREPNREASRGARAGRWRRQRGLARSAGSHPPARASRLRWLRGSGAAGRACWRGYPPRSAPRP